MAACGQGKKVRFYRVTELITQLLEAREERVLLRLKAQLAKLDLLILDELGSFQNNAVPASKIGSELLFDVISVECSLAFDTAYERHSVIVTSSAASDEHRTCRSRIGPKCSAANGLRGQRWTA